MISRKIHLGETITLLLLLVLATMQLCLVTVSSSAILPNEQGIKQAPPVPAASQQESQNHVDSMSKTKLQQQPATKQTNSQQETGGQQQIKQRSNNAADDDLIPLATINNHSRNNQNLLRPPQYVDVSALVSANGRNMTFATNGANTNGAVPVPPMGASNSISPNSVLSPKSRSGLPECATQQVCNAIFVRMNHTQRLCECSSNYNWKCSNNLDPQDGHTIELTRKFDKRIYTQIKTCEPLREVRACKSPTDWTLLALQSERSGKAHYVVVCKCPTWAQLEGPYTHNHPPYANIPGIRVYGMLCAHQTARSSTAQSYSSYNPSLGIYPEFPWSEALNVLNTTNLANTLDNGSH